MLENLFDLIKQHGTESVINNPDVPNEKNNAVLADATHSVANGLQSVLAGGGLQNILSMFGGNNAAGNTGGVSALLNNPIVSNIVSNFTNKLTDNHGIAGDKASGIAANLIPSVISSLISKTNDPNDNSFNLNGIISSLTGSGSTQTGGGGGIMDIIQGFIK
jgi:hypothetical protein